jgi:hypothetical protein
MMPFSVLVLAILCHGAPEVPFSYPNHSVKTIFL